MAATSALPRPAFELLDNLPASNRAPCTDCQIPQRYRSLVEASPSVILCLSPEHSIVEFNRAAERLYGYSRAAVLGRDYIQLFVPEDQRDAVVLDISRVLAGQPTRDFTNSVRTTNGAERVLLWNVSRILDNSGQATGVIAVGQDVTERMQAEEALRRYEYIVSTSSDLMAYVDTNYVYRAVNGTYVEAFGKPRRQIVGHKVADLLGQRVFNAQVKVKLDECLKGQQIRYQLWIDFPCWGDRCLDAHLNPFRDTEGNVRGVVVVGRDVTEQQRANQALIAHEQQLRMLASELALAGERERRRVAVGLHDQVGQALAMAKLKLRRAMQSELSADARRSLRESEALLDQSIRSTRTLTFQLSSVVLQELGFEAALQQLAEWFSNEYPGTRFSFDTDSALKAVSEDSGLTLYDIVRELLFNTVKHANANRVAVRLERTGDRVRIIVSDDGIGFDTACVEKGPSSQGGFGFFSIVERLAYLGGQLQLESSIGCGTKVMITAPLVEM